MVTYHPGTVIRTRSPPNPFHTEYAVSYIPGTGHPLVYLENFGHGKLSSPQSRPLDRISYLLRYQLICSKHDRFVCSRYPGTRMVDGYPDVRQVPDG